MSDQKKESRIKVDDLPAAEAELTAEEAKQVKGGKVSGEVNGLAQAAPNFVIRGNNTEDK